MTNERWRDGVVAALLAALVGGLTALSPADDSHSDPRYALLASESLVRHGTLSLDPYREQTGVRGDYRTRRIGRSIYYYSFGVPVVSAPFVAVANALGLEMASSDDEARAQNALSALLCAAIVVTLFATARSFVDTVPAAFIAGTATLGSPLTSTLGAGLWNAGWATLFVALALWVLARRAAEDAPTRVRDLALVALLGVLALACRPATGPFAVGVAAVLAFDRRRWIALTARASLAVAVAAVGLAALGGLDFLPDYYSPARLLGGNPLAAGLADTLASPSRGLLVYCPWVVLAIAAIVGSPRPWPAFGLCAGIGLWLVIETLALATKDLWWGGHSFGPRLWAQTMPGFALLAAVGWSALPRARRRVVGGLAIPAVAFALFVHVGQGLFNPVARDWNRFPDIDHHPELLADWCHAQWRASEAQLIRRANAHAPLLVERHAALRPQRADAPVELGLRPGWTPASAPLSTLRVFGFVSRRDTPLAAAHCELRFDARTGVEQSLTVYAGEDAVTEVTLSPGTAAQAFRLEVPCPRREDGVEVAQFRRDGPRDGPGTPVAIRWRGIHPQLATGSTPD